MRAFVTAAAAAALLLTTGSASYGHQSRAADAPCSGQIQPNPSFEHGTTGWTAGPRMVVLGDQARPAHTGRAYATFGGLDVSRSDLLRTTVTLPAGCTLTFSFWVRTTSTETMRGDYLNVGLAVTGIPPKTMYSLAFDGSREWYQYTRPVAAATTDRTVTASFLGSESAGSGVTTFDLDDVRFTLS